MHSPGVCGAILAIGPGAPHLPLSADVAEPVGSQGPVTPPQGHAQDVAALIDALNADTEMVLVAAAAEAADALAPAVWARAAYLVRLSPGATEADALRALLQETLSRGRDAVLVTTLEGPALTAEIVGRMVDSYRAAEHEIWAVALETQDPHHPSTPTAGAPGTLPQQASPLLLGRRMIELFLRGRQWRSVQEVLSANREHVRALNLFEEKPF